MNFVVLGINAGVGLILLINSFFVCWMFIELLVFVVENGQGTMP